jgi:Thiopurine S-methyltransferase (TPMT)
LVLKQTFFCAINPTLRQSYANKMNEIIVPQGKLVGVMFDKEFDFAGLPFGGCKCKYEGYFAPYFSFKTFGHCRNSIKARHRVIYQFYPQLENMASIILESIITCPNCGHQKAKTMPTDAC